MYPRVYGHGRVILPELGFCVCKGLLHPLFVFMSSRFFEILMFREYKNVKMPENTVAVQAFASLNHSSLIMSRLLAACPSSPLCVMYLICRMTHQCVHFKILSFFVTD